MKFADRKHPRLKNYDYSLPGYYYVTIHNERGAPALSSVRQEPMLNQRFQTPGRKQFQTSFYEKVLRNEQAYRECWRYIDENPTKWLLKPEDL